MSTVDEGAQGGARRRECAEERDFHRYAHGQSLEILVWFILSHSEREERNGDGENDFTTPRFKAEEKSHAVKVEFAKAGERDGEV